jgi:hypothetical protein
VETKKVPKLLSAESQRPNTSISGGSEIVAFAGYREERGGYLLSVTL